MNNLKKILVLILPVITAIGCYIFSVYNNTPRPYQYIEAIALLKQEGYIDRSKDDLLREVIIQINNQTHLFEHINVNDDYQRGALNIYVLKVTDKWETIDARVIKGLSKILNDNILAIPPNLLLVDSKFINLLIISLHNDSLGYSQALSMAYSKKNIDTESLLEIVKLGLIDMHLRLRNIQHSHSDAKYFEELSSEISKAYLITDFQVPFRLGIMPIVAHEYYHLKQYKKRKYFPSMEEISNKATNYFKNKTEEDEADEFAVSVIKKYIKEKEKEIGRSGAFSIELQPLATLAKLLQDIVLVDLFHHFRGLEADDLLIELWHETCNKQNTFLKSATFNNPDKVYQAFDIRLPLLTKEEFNYIRNLVNLSFGTNHANHLDRAHRILTILDQITEKNIADLVIRYRSFIEAVRKDNLPQLMNIDALKPIGISRNNLLKHFDDLISIVPSVSCAPRLCAVGFFNQGDGFIELIGTDENLREITYFLPVLNQNEDDQNYNKSMLIRFIANLLHDQRTGEKIYANILHDLEKCNSTTFLVETDQFQMLVTTVNERGWIKIRVAANGLPQIVGSEPLTTK